MEAKETNNGHVRYLLDHIKLFSPLRLPTQLRRTTLLFVYFRQYSSVRECDRESLNRRISTYLCYSQIRVTFQTPFLPLDGSEH